jgi:hypothetical protein
MSKKKRKKGKISGEGDRPFARGPFDRQPLDRPLPDQMPDELGANPFPPSPENSALAMRFIDTLERQLQAKDEQLRQMDARLQDAFDMQRALALIVRQFEQRTGISSDVLWDQVPEEELERQKPENQAEQAAEQADPTVPPQPEQASGQADAGSTRREGPRSFDEWLGELA